jgi:hypothetical protein
LLGHNEHNGLHEGHNVVNFVVLRVFRGSLAALKKGKNETVLPFTSSRQPQTTNSKRQTLSRAFKKVKLR